MKKLLTLVLVAAAIVVGAIYVKPMLERGGDRRLEAADVFRVERGQLEVKITEAAQLEAGRSADVTSKIEGRATILKLIQEGSTVKKGDELVRLDVSNLKDRCETQEISVSRAEASLVTAEKNLEIQKNQNESDVEAALNRLRFAQMDLEKFVGKTKGAANASTGASDGEGSSSEMGERDQQLVAAQADIENATEELNRAENRLEWTKKLHAQKYVTDVELEADRISVVQRKNQLKIARNRLFILENYTHEKSRIELIAKVDEARAELERTRLRCDAKLAQSTADFSSKKQQFELEDAKLKKLRDQIEAGVLYAPQDGLVVYAQVGDRRRREPIDEGTDVRQGQKLIILPDVTSMRVKASIHEAQVDKVAVGQKVTLRVDTFPDRVFFGEVSRVAVVPDSNSSWFNPEIKLYTTRIDLNGDTSMLKPGQSCSIEILVANVEDVLAVPVQAIQRDGRVIFVWEVTDDGYLAKPVELGISNDKFVVVTKGVDEMDRILLREPDGVAKPDFSALNAEIEKKALQAEKEIRGQPMRGRQITEASASRPRGRGRREGGGAGRMPTGEGRRPRGEGGFPRRGGMGEGGAGGGERRRGMGGGRRQLSPELQAASDELLTAIKARFPEEAGELTSLMGLFRNRELRAKIEADAELGKLYSEYIEKMRSSFGGMRRGREGGENRGEDGRGRRRSESGDGGR